MDLMNRQLKKAVDKIEEEHLRILILFKADRSRYGSSSNSGE